MIRIKKGDGQKFINAANAIMAMQAAQIYYALAGYLTTSSINIENGRCELSVHFDGKPYPKLPNGYKYSTKEITSHEFYSEVCGGVTRVRCLDFKYKF